MPSVIGCSFVASEAPTPLPDYVSSPNAVLGDTATWRHGKAPDYAKTRKYWEDTKSKFHPAGSLEELVENLVKNWEVEASFKLNFSDWRTVNSSKYTFAINGGKPQDASHMLKVGTYNAVIAPNDFYSPSTSDFASSHKTFKRMMPTFAWEILEVYSGPPRVAFKWRHWGFMKNDYVGFNDKGEKINAKAHGGNIDIQGLTVATIDESIRIEALETWFDPLEMFRQIAPDGIVTRVSHKATPGEDLTQVLDETFTAMTDPEHPRTLGLDHVPGAFPEPSATSVTSQQTAAEPLLQLSVPVITKVTEITEWSSLVDTTALNELVSNLSVALEALKKELTKQKHDISDPGSNVQSAVLNAASSPSDDPTNTSESTPTRDPIIPLPPPAEVSKQAGEDPTSSHIPGHSLDSTESALFLHQKTETVMSFEEMQNAMPMRCPFI